MAPWPYCRIPLVFWASRPIRRPVLSLPCMACERHVDCTTTSQCLSSPRASVSCVCRGPCRRSPAPLLLAHCPTVFPTRRISLATDTSSSSEWALAACCPRCPCLCLPDQRTRTHTHAHKYACPPLLTKTRALMPPPRALPLGVAGASTAAGGGAGGGAGECWPGSDYEGVLVVGVVRWRTTRAGGGASRRARPKAGHAQARGQEQREQEKNRTFCQPMALSPSARPQRTPSWAEAVHRIACSAKRALDGLIS
ncbi:hypothetical protein ACJBU6_08435 [Exserohilum turcicum]